MFEQTQPVSFFLGANTPSGFVGYLDDLYDAKSGWHAFLIKSGPGTGKNTLIRAVLHAMVALEEPVEAICCSSDPNSLDGLRCPRLKLCILDATAPHIMEPRYWGAGEETVDLCACMRSALLRSDAAEIIRLTDACSAMHARCRSLLRGASVFLNETAQIAAEYTDFSKIVHTADRIAAFTFGRKSAVPGTETRRFLSAVTPEGHVFFEKTIPSLCDTIYSIEDETGAVSGVFLSVIREKALQAGYPIITCACPLNPQKKLEHLLIPSLHLGFTTANRWHRLDAPVFRRIHAARFTDLHAMRARKQTMAFYRRTAKLFLQEAISAAKSAKLLHDQMESFYIPAMNWEKADVLQHSIVSQFESASRAYSEKIRS